MATAADGVASGTWSWGYDTAGRVTSEVQAAVSTAANPIRYDLDLYGSRDNLYWPDGAKYFLNYNYNNIRIGGQLTLPGKTKQDIWYGFPDPFDQPVLVELPPIANPFLLERSFDNGGGGLDIASVSITPPSALGTSTTATYTYDMAHHLTKVATSTGGPQIAHPSTANTLAGLTAKGNNELVNPDPNHTLSYDANGNLMADGPLSGGQLTVTGTHEYTYAQDGSGRMLTAQTKGGASATYQYDPFGRRTNKTVGGVTTRFMFDSTNHEIGEYDSTGHLLRRLLYDPDFAARSPSPTPRAPSATRPLTGSARWSPPSPPTTA